MTTVEKIHQEIDTAQFRILDNALQTIKESNEKISKPLNLLESKGERLRKLGFENTELGQMAVRTDNEKERLKAINKDKTKEAQRVNYYVNTYPFLKFITESEMDRICKKYNLIYAKVDAYAKDVPEKNLKEIENAQTLKSEDNPRELYLIKQTDRTNIFHTLTFGQARQVRKGIVTDDIVKSWGNVDPVPTIERYFNKLIVMTWESLGWEVNKIERDGLFIAAPKSHFKKSKLKQMNKIGKFGMMSLTLMPIKDPIVFRYVKGGIQILSKWGDEADDLSLLIPQTN